MSAAAARLVEHDVLEAIPPPAAPASAPVLGASPAFAAFLAQGAARTTTSRARRLACGLSIVVHGGLVVAGLVYSLGRVTEIPTPAVAVKFVNLPATAISTTTPPRATRDEIFQVPPRKRLLTTPAVVQPPEEPAPGPEETENHNPSAYVVAASGGAEGSVVGGEGEIASSVPPPLPPKPPALTAHDRARLLERYLQELFRTRIASRFRYPAEAERLGIEGTVVVRVSIDHAGNLLATALAGDCAHEILCEAAHRTIREATPFPSPPPELGSRIQVDVPLVYRLE